MADNAPITGAVNAATFDVTAWLSHFASMGGSYLATESQTSFCLACESMGSSRKSPALALLNSLTDDQRAEVVAHIRALAGLSPALKESASQPDLNAIPLEKLSEPAGIPAASGGPSLDQLEGSHDMDMTHAFVPATTDAKPAGWDQVFAAYEAAKAAEDAFDAEVWAPAQKRQDEFEALVGIHGYTQETDKKRRALMEKFPDEYVSTDVNREMDRLQGVRIGLEHALMDMPAPDLDALRWKLRLQRRTSEDHVIEPEIFDTILAELDRLFGKAASPRAYFAELDALDALAATLDDTGTAETDWDRWEQWSIALWAKIEALPATAEYAHIKARAIWSIIGGDLDDLASDKTTCERLARQVILGLVRSGAQIPRAADAKILTAWQTRQTTLAIYNALPMDGGEIVDGMTPDERQCREIMDTAEETILDAVALTLEGAATQLKVALYSMLSKKTEEEALTRGDLSYLEEHANLQWGERAVVAALRSLKAQSSKVDATDLVNWPQDWETAYAAAKRAEAAMLVAYDAQSMAENAYAAALPADVAACFNGHSNSQHLTDEQRQTVRTTNDTFDIDPLEKAADAAGNVFYAALDKLFAIPAPDLSHVLEKMELAHQHGEELNAFTHVMGDLRRLIGGVAITGERQMAA